MQGSNFLGTEFVIKIFQIQSMVMYYVCLLGPWRLWVMKQEFVIVNASFFQILAATVAFLMPHLLNIFQTNCSCWKSKTKIFLRVTFFPGKTSTAPGF